MSVSDSYNILARLGEQKRRKFGELFLAEHKETREKVVIKIVSKTPTNRQIALRLSQEALFSFQFKGLPKILAFEDLHNKVILIREYIDGISLDAFWNGLKRKHRIPFIKKLMQQLNSILQELERQRIVHCDIKPSNIIIGDQGKSIHLIDFGLALNTDKQEKRTILFPLGYAAPELLLNHLDLVRSSTDIYALGIVFWRLFAGKLPLTHANPSIFTNLQLTYPLPYDRSIPKQLFPIIQKMTVKHQFQIPPNKMGKSEVKELLQSAIEKRYQNSIDLTEDLEQIRTKRRILPKNIFSKP